MNGPTLSATGARLTLPFNDANRRWGTTITYTKVVSHLFRRFATDADIGKAENKVRSFKVRFTTGVSFFPKVMGPDV